MGSGHARARRELQRCDRPRCERLTDRAPPDCGNYIPDVTIVCPKKLSGRGKLPPQPEPELGLPIFARAKFGSRDTAPSGPLAMNHLLSHFFAHGA
jgi:hypothetical protein